MPKTDPILQLIQTADQETLAKATYFQAQVTAIEAGTNRVYVQRIDDEDGLPDEEPYTVLGSVVPAINEWVLLANWGRSAFVMGVMQRTAGGYPMIYRGIGSPESVVSAPLSSLYLRGDPTTDQEHWYIKALGTGNTGWQQAWLYPGNPDIISPPGLTLDEVNNSAFGSNNTYAIYLGKADRTITTATVRVQVNVAAVTITWAEVAIGVSAGFTVFQSVSIEEKGFTNVATSFNSTGEKTVTITTTGIDRGDNVWLLVGSQATTPFQLQASDGGALSAGMIQTRSTNRPSTQVGTPLYSALIDATGFFALVSLD